jgi:hypothetical protein
MKGSNCSHKLRYGEYIKLMCRCLLDDMYNELTRMKISYGEITYVYENAYVIIV